MTISNEGGASVEICYSISTQLKGDFTAISIMEEFKGMRIDCLECNVFVRFTCALLDGTGVPSQQGNKEHHFS